MKFFLNSSNKSYLRDLEGEFGVSTNAIRLELNRMEDAGLLKSHRDGNKKMYQANCKHPLFDDLNSILLKHTGLEYVIEKVIEGLGGLDSAYVTGHFARGEDNPVIDLLFVGRRINMDYLQRVIMKAEKFIGRRIRYMIIEPREAEKMIDNYPEALLLWKR